MCKISLILETGEEQPQRQAPVLPMEAHEDKSQKQQSSLTVSDWIAFLSSEKQSSYQVVDSAVIISIAITALVVAILGSITNVPESLYAWILFLLIGFMLILFRSGPQRNSDMAKKLLRQVMKGELPTPADISAEWKKQFDLLEKYKWWMSLREDFANKKPKKAKSPSG